LSARHVTVYTQELKQSLVLLQLTHTTEDWQSQLLWVAEV